MSSNNVTITDDAEKSLRINVTRALSGQVLCQLSVPVDATVLRLRECIQNAVGIPWHDQRLFVGSVELNKRDLPMADVLDGKAPEVAVMVRKYERQEMQAAWLIEGIWKRRRQARGHEDAIANAAARRIGDFWRARRQNAQAGQTGGPAAAVG